MDASDWSGPIGSVWAAEWERTDRSFADLSPHLEAAALAVAPAGPARIIDIGCGAGVTSLAIARARPDAQITGVDISPDLIAVARDRGAGLANLTFVDAPVQDAATALAPVDLYVSRHGVMFFPDPVAAFSALRAAASDNAQLIFTCFRAVTDNPWAVSLMTAATGAPPSPPTGYTPGPFAFADPAFVTDLLARAGWIAAAPKPVDYTYIAGAGDDPVGDALSFFKRIGPTAGLLRAAEGDERAAMIGRLRAVLERQRVGNHVDFPAAAWLWSAKAA